MLLFFDMKYVSLSYTVKSILNVCSCAYKSEKKNPQQSVEKNIENLFGERHFEIIQGQIY